MDYFNEGIRYIKKNPMKSLIIAGLDAVFYLLFMPIANFSIDVFFKQISRIPIQTMGAMMQSMDVDALQQLQMKLFGIFFGVIGSVLLFIALILLNIAIFKGIIWIVTLKKKIDYKILLKGVLLIFSLGTIFSVFFILSLIPLLTSSKDYVTTQVINVGFGQFIPLIIALFITLYFSTLALYFLFKEGKFRKAFKNCFKIGVTKASTLLLPFVWFFITSAAVIKIVGNLGLLQFWYGSSIAFVFIIVASFFNRIYIKRTV